jgi:hypothetical protein
VFEAAAKKYGWAINEAQFDIARRACGHGLTESALVEAVNAGTLSLQAAPPAALAQYRHEAMEARQDFLINQATPQQLRLGLSI